MHHVPLPDPLYVEAERFAAASGQTVEAYVLEAVRLRLSDDAPIVLSPSQIAACDRAEAQIDAGDFMTSDQVREHFTHKVATWTEK